MNATEVIAEIERLPAAEFAKVYSVVTARFDQLQETNGDAQTPQPKVRYADAAAFEAAAEHVFTRHDELLRRLAE